MPYTPGVPIGSGDLTERLERADRARLALRRTTHELQALGAQLRQDLARRHALGPRLFKLLSTRDRDLEDAVTVLRAPDLPLDRSFIDAEASGLAAEISDHDVTARLARLHAAG